MNTEITGNEPSWAIPNEQGMIDVPDELMPLFNSIGLQFNFVDFADKNQNLAIAHIIMGTKKFWYEKFKADTLLSELNKTVEP